MLWLYYSQSDLHACTKSPTVHSIADLSNTYCGMVNWKLCFCSWALLRGGFFSYPPSRFTMVLPGYMTMDHPDVQ